MSSRVSNLELMATWSFPRPTIWERRGGMAGKGLVRAQPVPYTPPGPRAPSPQAHHGA